MASGGRARTHVLFRRDSISAHLHYLSHRREIVITFVPFARKTFLMVIPYIYSSSSSLRQYKKAQQAYKDYLTVISIARYTLITGVYIYTMKILCKLCETHHWQKKKRRRIRGRDPFSLSSAHTLYIYKGISHFCRTYCLNPSASYREIKRYTPCVSETKSRILRGG